MAVRREEEKLGTFTLLRHGARIMGYVRGRAWLLWVCMAVSVVQAGVELSLPLLVRKGLDAYILPPYSAVRNADEVLLGRLESESEGAAVVTRDGAFVRSADLPRALSEELKARGLLTSERYHRLPSGEFVSEAELGGLDPQSRRAVLQEQRGGLLVLAALYVGLLVANFLLGYGVTYGLNDLGQRAVARMRRELFSHLHRLPIRFFDENPVGRLVTRLTNDTAALSELFTSVVATAVSDVALFAGILVVLFSLDAGLAARLLLLAPPLFLLALWFKSRSQRIYRELRVQLARLNTFLQEAVQGVSVLKAFTAEARASKRFHDLGAENFRTQMRLIYVFAVFRPLIDAFATAAVALVVGYGGLQALGGGASIGTLVAFLIYLKMLFMPLQDLAEKFNIVQSSVVASERLFRILDTPEEDPGGGLAPEEGGGAIAFENVSFAYEEGQTVLKNVSFEVPGGTTVALVGPTGSGKTTLTSLLLRFYPLAKGDGRILVDGHPVESWDVHALRRRFAFVQQDLFLFAGSLRENVTLREEVTEDRLKAALGASRMSAVIERLAGGLDFPVNERGTVLSQGERQLVSFCRALVAEPRILVLDEATASVDSKTESLIQEALKELLKGRTALVVAHRLSTIQDADQILVLHKGRIVERGTHAELLARGGLYAHLYHTQFASPLGEGAAG
ncbi:MAG: ABC transporter ATP-binding protein [Acidobacteriota bacterium]